MAKFLVTLEETSDGGWSAHTTEPDVIGGLGASREDAIADWTQAMTAWLEYMKDTGQQVVLREVVDVEIAA